MWMGLTGYWIKVGRLDNNQLGLMGGEDSKTESQDDYFLLEHLSKMSLQNRKTVSYYLISQNKVALQPLLGQLRQYFKIDLFPSVTTLKQEMSFVHRYELVKVVIADTLSAPDLDYLAHESKISQLITYNCQGKTHKTAAAAASPEQLVKVLNDLEQKDALQIPSSNILFLIDQDTKTLNKYRLSYHCNTHYLNRQSAKDDLVKLARKVLPQHGATIDQFQREYDLKLTKLQRRKMVLSWAFKDSFYWDLVSTLSRNSTDPKRLAYIRLALKDIYECVAEEHRANPIYDPFFIIIDLNQQQKAKLQRSQNNFMLFSSFFKGMFSQKEANLQLKRRPNAFQFEVHIDRREKEDLLDFGFIRNPDSTSPYDVLLNIYNVFRVEAVNLKTRKGELLYGILPIMNKKRQQEQSRGNMSKVELDLTRNYDFMEDLMGKIDGQATLLQMSGYYQDSLDIYDKKVDFIRKSMESQYIMNRCLIKKADALVLSGEIDSAEREYQSVSTKSPKIRVIGLIHQADMYLRLGEEAKIDKVINELEPLLSTLENDEKERDEYFKGKHFIAIKALRKGSYGKAQSLLQQLITSISEAYSYSMEGRPLYHDIHRSMAAVQSKLGRHGDALITLNATLALQLACEGKTHNVALTQTLIQSVCRTSGNQAELTKSQQRLTEMSAEIDSNQGRLSSSTVVSLNESMVNLSL